MMPSQTENLGVIVLGMYRSGTSLAANLLAAGGAHVDNTIPADDGNPRGYWESREVEQINRRILASVGATLNWVPKLSPKWPVAPRLDRYREQARRVISELRQYPIWVLKDPRFSVTLPFWLPLFDRPIRCVICLRNPLEVAESARASHRDIQQFLWGWYGYTTLALRNTAGNPRFLSCYERYFDRQSSSQITRLLEFAGLELRVDPSTIIDPKLHRNRVLLSNFLHDDHVPSAVKQLYQQIGDCGSSSIEMVERNSASGHVEPQSLTLLMRSLFFRFYGLAWLTFRESPLDSKLPHWLRKALIRTIARWTT